MQVIVEGTYLDALIVHDDSGNRAIVSAVKGEGRGAGGVGQDVADDPAVDHGHHLLVGMGVINARQTGGDSRVKRVPAFSAGNDVPALFRLHLHKQWISSSGFHTQHAAFPFPQAHFAQISLDFCSQP